jgi:predicted acyltransferase
MRLTSLDVFRGITIAGMILFNMVGVADNKYSLLDHAEWNGCTLADLIFPFFLFIVGVGMAFSLSKYTVDKNPLKRFTYVSCAALLFFFYWDYYLMAFGIKVFGLLT